jgi:hypothetical protein
MSKVLDYKYSAAEIDFSEASASSKVGEKNDCSVRAIATAVGVTYNAAHEYMRTVFGRKNRKGAKGMTAKLAALTFSDKPTQTAGDVKFEYKSIPQNNLCNQYKLHGEIVHRKKTVKSFIDDFRDGTFLVFVSDHVFTVKDGVLIDNNGEEFRPTRKVLNAFRVNVIPREVQLELFPQAA